MHTRNLSRLLLPLTLALGTTVCAASPRRPSPVEVAAADSAEPDKSAETAPYASPIDGIRTAERGGGFDHSHAAWTAILRQNVRGTNFNYGGLKESRAAFDAYLRTLEGVAPEELQKWSKDQRFAFWINAYNAHTIQKVVDNYPLKSIRKLDTALGLNSVFDKEFIPMRPHHPKGAQDDLSLNDIEHGILRAEFKDARLHAAINCASISCPPLLNEAFTADKLDSQLTAQMRAFVNDPARNKIDQEKKRMRISKIFKWFKEDFVRDAGSVNDYMSRYADDDVKSFIGKSRFGYLDYDWGLNDARDSS